MRRAVVAVPLALGLSTVAAPESGSRRENVPTADIVPTAVAERVAAPEVGEVPYGDPVSTSGTPTWTMLKRAGYLAAYDEKRRNPAWVCYSYEFSASIHKGHKRVSGFTIDRDTQALIADGDYDHSGFSRGHMAPSFGIFTYFGKDAQKETYLMSNVVPQKQAMNAGPWEDAEDRTANRFAKTYGRVWTIDGPIYPKKPKTISDRDIHVPEATFKIIVRYDSAADQPRVIAFLVPQTAKQKDPAVRYLASVDEIERRSGLDFFSELPDELEDAIERTRETKLWQ